MKYIYHITTQQAWEQAQETGIYTAPSLETEGFIHCSTLQQVIPVANAFYRDVSDLLLLEIEVDRLESEVKWEAPAHPDPDNPPETDEEQLFPHVYGVIKRWAIVYADKLYETNGKYRLPETFLWVTNWENLNPEDMLLSVTSMTKNRISSIHAYADMIESDAFSNDDLEQYKGMIKQSAEGIIKSTFTLWRIDQVLMRYALYLREQREKDDS